MSQISYIASVGRTPIVKLERFSAMLGAELYAKQERCNPSGSVKDRIAMAMVMDAIERGILFPNSDKVRIIEPTSGNTGIGLAAIGAALGIGVTLMMPETMTEERRRAIQVYGAELVLTPGAQGMKGAIAAAFARCKAEPEHYFMPMQFENPVNVSIHERKTAPEIEEALGKVDMLVAGVGTGGTITGTGRYFKPKYGTRVVAVEPATSPVIRQTLNAEPIQPGPHGIQGIGAGFVPKILDLKLLDDVVPVSTEEAIRVAREILRHEGLSCGISGGGNVAAVLALAQAGKITPGSRVVTFIPDGADKYYSTKLGESV